ncbi:MAG: holin [Lachnospiraceae bacterium]|nr:holin [Lachnospiraceae bacterium]
MSKTFWKCALIRAVRTLCQTAIATIGTTAVLQEVDWLLVLSSAGLAALLSILNSIATGLPEADE